MEFKVKLTVEPTNELGKIWNFDRAALSVLSNWPWPSESLNYHVWEHDATRNSEKSNH